MDSSLSITFRRKVQELAANRIQQNEEIDTDCFDLNNDDTCCTISLEYPLPLHRVQTLWKGLVHQYYHERNQLSLVSNKLETIGIPNAAVF